MKNHILIGLCFIVAAVTLARGAETPPNPPATTVSPPSTSSSVEIDAAMQAVLDEINKATAYRPPQLPLRTDDRYAHTPDEVTPHGFEEPFKRHFLLQMEYTGSGRSIPEPDEIQSVKIGFLGPIERTVSVATGGVSHEEYLGQPMLQGCQLAIAQANAQGGYRETQYPL